ncbi:hypothetical protein ACFLXI_06265 [Chloroflexota bacterium]
MMKSKTAHKYFRSLFLIGLILIIFILDSSQATAQMGDYWSPQRNIPLYHPDTFTPYLIADQDRTVHAFSSQWIGTALGTRAIIYNQWNLDTGWTEPVDIIFPPIKGDARILGVYLDPSSIFHVALFSGDETEARIYYSQAPARMADQAHAWTAPALIGKQATVPEHGTIAGDGDGNLVIVYNGEERGKGLYAVYSEVGGSAWSEPVSIYLTENDEFTPYFLNTILGESGQLYAVWSVQNKSNHGLAILFSSLDFNEQQWSEPLPLAETRDSNTLGTWLPIIFEFQDTMFLTYYDGSVTGKFYQRRSSDLGKTWTRAYAPFPHVGSNLPTSFVVDSNEDLHVFWAQRVTEVKDESAVHGVWHSVWDNQNKTWSPYESIVRGQVIHDKEGFTGFDPSRVRAVVSQGNVLLVVWKTDPLARGNGIWYSYTVLDAPELPVVPLTTLRPETAPTSEATVFTSIHNPTSTPIPFVPEPDDPGSGLKNILANPSTPIIGAIFFVIVLLVTVILLPRLSPFTRNL